MPKPHVLIETARLSLSIPNADDAKKMAEYMLENAASFRSTSAYNTKTLQHQYWADKLHPCNEHFECCSALVLAVYEKGKFDKIIGNISIDGVVGGAFQSCYLGFRLDHRFRKQGLMYEALNSTIDYVFKNWDIHRIEANHLPTNLQSANLLNKLGFKFEGHAKKYLFINGDWRDHVMTALINTKRVLLPN